MSCNAISEYKASTSDSNADTYGICGAHSVPHRPSSALTDGIQVTTRHRGFAPPVRNLADALPRWLEMMGGRELQRCRDAGIVRPDRRLCAHRCGAAGGPEMERTRRAATVLEIPAHNAKRAPTRPGSRRDRRGLPGQRDGQGLPDRAQPPGRDTDPHRRPAAGSRTWIIRSSANILRAHGLRIPSRGQRRRPRVGGRHAMTEISFLRWGAGHPPVRDKHQGRRSVLQCRHREALGDTLVHRAVVGPVRRKFGRMQSSEAT